MLIISQPHKNNPHILYWLLSSLQAPTCTLQSHTHVIAGTHTDTYYQECRRTHTHTHTQTHTHTHTHTFLAQGALDIMKQAFLGGKYRNTHGALKFTSYLRVQCVVIVVTIICIVLFYYCSNPLGVGRQHLQWSADHSICL